MNPEPKPFLQDIPNNFDQRPAKWIAKFEATRGDQKAIVKMGAFGNTWEEAKQFVRDHCAGQYDSMGEIAEVNLVP